MSLIKRSCWLMLCLSLSLTSPGFAEDTPPSSTSTPPAATSEAQPSKPFQLGIEQKDFLAPTPPPQTYPVPAMVPQNPSYAPQGRLNGNAQQGGPLNGNIQQGPPGIMQPMNPQSGQMPQQPMQQPQSNVLPPQFLGRWLVNGNRTNVQALPQYQAGMDGIFSMQTQNVWTIGGNPQQGYNLATDQGVTTQVMVQMNGDTAILRYQHPIHNTVAQEALVLQLLQGGMVFNGLERISIVKQGEPMPRAKVEYNLVGHRQQ